MEVVEVFRPVIALHCQTFKANRTQITTLIPALPIDLFHLKLWIIQLIRVLATLTKQSTFYHLNRYVNTLQTVTPDYLSDFNDPKPWINILNREHEAQVPQVDRLRLVEWLSDH